MARFCTTNALSQDEGMRLLYSRSDVGASHELDTEQLIDLYRHPRPADATAWVRTNFVTTLDGSIQGLDGRSGSINTPSDHWLFALHRAHADAIVVGAGTVRSEGYRAVDLTGWQRDVRSSLGLAPFPLLVVVSASLDIDPLIAAEEATGPVMIITTEDHSTDEHARFVDAGIEVLATGRSSVDLPVAIDQLAGLGCQRLLCEGGPHLHRDLLAADLVDELSTTVSPSVVGGVGQRSTAGDALPDLRTFALESAVLAEDGALFTRYRRTRG